MNTLAIGREATSKSQRMIYGACFSTDTSIHQFPVYLGPYHAEVQPLSSGTGASGDWSGGLLRSTITLSTRDLD
jgi:hypothetical protein